jgi:hypothetical protein
MDATVVSERPDPRCPQCGFTMVQAYEQREPQSSVVVPTGLYRCFHCLADPQARGFYGVWFPIQAERGTAPHPTRVPWSVADKAYSVYAARYGKGQSLARLAERGGFGPSEMDDFFPGWREEAAEITNLRRQLAALQKAAHP